MSRRARELCCALLALALSAALCACEAAQATGVLVIVDSDIAVPSALRSIRIRLFDRSGNPLGDGHQPYERYVDVARESTAQHRFPLSFGVAPEHGDDLQDFRVVVTGLRGADVEVVEQQAIVSFRRGVTLRLEMFLASTCLDTLCREQDNMTCDPRSAECEDVPVLKDLPRAQSDDDLGGYAPRPAPARSDAGAGAMDAAAEAEADALEADADALVADAALEVDAPPGCDESGAACACRAGEVRNARGECEPRDDCLQHACLNGARCVDGVDSYSCDCGDSGCSGRYCGLCPTPCASGACQHNGACLGDGSCDCTGTGFDGVHCEHNIDDCPGNACQHGASCVDGIKGYSCNCGDSGFDGPRCEHDIDDCAGNACQNGASCVDGIKSYTCNCGTSGCTGQFCENCGNLCASVVCQHGTCAGGACDCDTTGYIGARCETATVCTGANLCTSASYPCLASSPADYSCRGQFADWPMPDQGGRVAPRYQYDADGVVVRDLVTGLMWERIIIHGQAYKRFWNASVSYCANATTGGFSDWRVPSKIEMESIVDFTREPASDEAVFPDTPADVFWTSSPYADATKSGYAWVVAFSSGDSQPQRQASTGCYVRCVRKF